MFQITGRTVFTSAALVFVALLLWISSGYPPRARQVPDVVGWFALICLILQLVLDSVPRLTSREGGLRLDEVVSVEDHVREARATEKTQGRLEIIAFCWLAFLLAGLVLLGFLVFIPVYILCYLRFQAAHSWLRATIYAGATWLFVYLLFVRLFEIRLYHGMILERFLDL